MDTSFEASRAAGLARLKEFVPLASDAHYARHRNYDRGPDDRGNVSLLSPYLSHRLVGEWEVVAAVVRAHGYADSSKFIDEVFWRTYWKGWLQHRPVVWDQYLAELDCPVSSDLKARLLMAQDGATGITCFDAWVRELREQGYLHNHARMWFASIWIFTLNLPWFLGAEFFLRHLVDADAASNTLSWRWVAGLHTQGKTYLARENNIAKFTAGRFAATPGLATDAAPPQFIAPSPTDLKAPPAVALHGRVGVLVTDMDLALLELHESHQVQTIVGLTVRNHLARGQQGAAARSFSQSALQSGVAHMSQHYDAHAEAPVGLPEHIVAWANHHGLDTVVTADLPAGPGEPELRLLGRRLEQLGITFVRQARRWDQICWPHCQKGFFALRKAIPLILDTFGLAPAR